MQGIVRCIEKDFILKQPKPHPSLSPEFPYREDGKGKSRKFRRWEMTNIIFVRSLVGENEPLCF